MLPTPNDMKQYVPLLAIAVTVLLAVTGVVAGYGAAVQRIEANAEVNSAQWRQISNADEKLEELRDRISRLEGKVE